MSTVILKYNAGNIQSVIHALNRLGETGIVSDDPDIIKSAHRVIFPGVGEASTAMEYLRLRGLDKIVFNLTQPVLGICLGMQLMCEYSNENNTCCIGVFKSKLEKFNNPSIIVPHMGWNQLVNMKGSLFNGVKNGSYVYFAHSYYSPLVSQTVAESTHGTIFSAALQKDNFYGVQFHPEKSNEIGEIILRNFLSL